MRPPESERGRKGISETALQKHLNRPLTIHAVMGCQGLRLRPRHLSSPLAVGLVANQREHEVRVTAVAASVFNPFGDTVETASICQIEADQTAVGIPVVPVGGGGVGL